MPSKDDRRAELEAELAELDKDDESDEVTLSHGDKSFSGSMRRARQVAAAWGIKLEADPPSKGDSGANPSKGDAEVKRFTSGRRTG